ncbi:DNA primase [archaeon CG10_big_fil_rev_8_21_14_0_10_43_11]|nr:MAG: DNA primase [archaeon CG10_big_fil_rev_8_21_14_0_10_43_11]
MRYSFPNGMRPATLRERELFYTHEFNAKQVRSWLAKKSVLFAIKIGMLTRVYKKEFAKDKDYVLVLLDTTKQSLKKDLLHYLPESAYYDRNVYGNLKNCAEHDLNEFWNWKNFLGQELCFDVDPENIACPTCGSLEERMKRNQTFTFCMSCFETTKQNTLRLYELLKQKGFKHVKIVFSGRGFHVHVFDKQAYTMTRAQRKELSAEILRAGIEHDEWVSEGVSRLIRLPYSLNALVSRVVTPLTVAQLKTFNLETDAKPHYLSQKK